MTDLRCHRNDCPSPGPYGSAVELAEHVRVAHPLRVSRRAGDRRAARLAKRA